MKVALIALALILTGCSSTQLLDAQTSDAMEIIRDVAVSAPKSVPGKYILSIKATGKPRSTVYLNTESDYRDQRNVTVALLPEVAALLESKYGQSSQEFFINKTISVKGNAQRVKIDFFNHLGQPSGKYYYQTHIPVYRLSQIEVMDKSA